MRKLGTKVVNDVRGFGRVENVSVGGDGSVGGTDKGKHEKEPAPSDEASTPSDASVDDASVDDADFDDADFDDDVPEHIAPYDAVTEVMSAIDPDAPAPSDHTVPDETVPDAEADGPAVNENADSAAVEESSEPDSAADETSTEVFPLVTDSPVDEAAVNSDAPTAAVPPAAVPPAEVPPAAVPPAAGKPPWVKVAVLSGAVVAVLAVLYTADILSSSGSVPRGVTVAGIEVGGLSNEDADILLRSELGPRVEQPVQIDAGEQQLELVPAAAGLDVDWAATLDRAGSQPINPFTRLMSFFSDREIGVQSTADPVALDAAVESLRAQVDQVPVEGDIVFEGVTPVAVTPAPGRSMDVAGAREAVETRWAFGTVDVPVEMVDVTVHQDEVDRVLAEVARPAVSAPVVFSGRENTNAVLEPDVIARVLSFESDGEGALIPRYDVDAAIGVLAPQLASTETPPKDASFALGGGVPTVVPGVVGDLVQWPRTLEQLPVLLASTDARTAEAVYEPAPPELTTERAEALGIKEVIGEYTTGGFEYASGVNIRLTADIVNGALVEPGETFSLNGYTGPRGYAQGFVESGIIDNGRPDRAVGGGISQFATTLYNAAYFAGMEDAGHTEHSYYISRYPEAREATVFEGAIDLQFTNTAETGVVIESFGTSSNVTVRLWGTKTVEVESITGPRSNPTSPNTITLPAGSGCVPSGGGPGFTASNTRVITDIETGSEISRNTRTVKYDPIPIVRCISPEPDPAPEPAPEPADEPASDPGDDEE
ncbi:VanW family protein [Rhodococcus sp. BGS-1C]